eukprot:5497037-Alexandrium_andersonii.AAC.1
MRVPSLLPVARRVLEGMGLRRPSQQCPWRRRPISALRARSRPRASSCATSSSRTRLHFACSG